MLSEKVRDIRVNWKISDDKRDEGLTIFPTDHTGVTICSIFIIRKR